MIKTNDPQYGSDQVAKIVIAATVGAAEAQLVLKQLGQAQAKALSLQR